MYDILIVDGNGVAHRAGNVLQLKNDKGENTSVTFGVMNMIRSMIERFDIRDICVCWDCKGSVSKSLIFPEYKKQRKDRKDKQSPEHYTDVEAQINKLFEILPAFGVKQLRREGVEADDIIGLLCEELRIRNSNVLILSSDQDLFQLVEMGASVYYPHRDLIFTKENFEKEIGMKPGHFIFYKTLRGDPGDNIKGLDGFGEVTAKKFINKYGAWTEWFDYMTEGDKVRHVLRPDIALDSLNAKQRTSIQDSKALEILLRNYSLMRVGWLDKQISNELLEDFNKQDPNFTEEKVREYFLDQQFDSYLQRWRSWTHPFRMLFRKGKVNESS